jgi:hypothetical protein
MLKAFVFALFLFTSACAYRFGFSERSLPGGYTQVAIPVFKNMTQQVGVEVPFTNALINRFARSQVARVSDKDSSPLTLEGTIRDIKVEPQALQTNAPGQLTALPDDAVLVTEYRIVVATDLVLRRKSDEKVVWQGSFTNEKVYPAPRIGTPVINSANATYNQSVRMQTISLVADEMMSEAHDRITENF